MNTNKIAIAIIALAISGSAFADGRGAAGAANGGSEGASGSGESQSLGYFPGWQTASPAKVAAEAAKYQKAPATKIEAVVWPSWVQVASK